MIVDDAEIRRFNAAYRDKDAATDVLSFPLWEEQPLFNEADKLDFPLGDVVISLERAHSQAAQYGHGLTRELVFLFVHGLLHLLGYDHELGPEAEAAMFAQQDEIMSELGLAR